jgi:hypothetical protein
VKHTAPFRADCTGLDRISVMVGGWLITTKE